MLVYYGDSYHLIPRSTPPGADEMARLSAASWGDEEGDRPTHAAMGLHLVQRLIEAEFDVASANVQKPGEGMAHGFGFMLDRMMPGMSVPFVPIILNVHTPPNQPTPKRLYDFGRAVRDAVRAWPGDERVAVFASGGLSVGIVDEEMDRLALAGMAERDTAKLAMLPRTWPQGSQGEVLCWIAAAGACRPPGDGAAGVHPRLPLPRGHGLRPRLRPLAIAGHPLAVGRRLRLVERPENMRKRLL